MENRIKCFMCKSLGKILEKVCQRCAGTGVIVLPNDCVAQSLIKASIISKN